MHLMSVTLSSLIKSKTGSHVEYMNLTEAF